MSGKYGIVEEVGASIGYTATALLVDWFGGGNLWVPQEAEETHPICQVIGMPAMKALIRFVDRKATNKTADRLLWLPLGYQREIDRRDRLIAALLETGIGVSEVASVAGMSRSHVYEVRQRVERMGILPLILRKAKIPSKSAGENPPPDLPGKAS